MPKSASLLDRREVVARLLAQREGFLVVSGLGSPTYDVHAAGDHDGNFYLWGAMGSAALIGLGLAQAQPDRNVVVITGDGEQLMGLGGLATIAVSNPRNLVVVVIDNDHFGETGMQTSHTGHGLDLASVAQSCGFAQARTVRDMAGVEQVARALDSRSSGARFFVIKVKAENPPRSLPARDAVYIKNRFRAHLGFGTI
jgi:thiamine pyrophosphate-dependent acetolactate synthase large subunit-like protein